MTRSAGCRGRGTRDEGAGNYLKRIAFIGVILVITYEGMISIKVQKINVPAFKMRMYIHDMSIGTVET